MLGERKGLQDGFVEGAEHELVRSRGCSKQVDGDWGPALLPNDYIVVVGVGHPEPTYLSRLVR